MKYSLYALLGFTVVCLFVFMFVSSFLLYFTSPNSNSQHLQYFGQVGDFFGGMLNPVLAFASFIALLYTIRIQSEELRLTKDELAKSADAHVKSEATLRQQLDESKEQHQMNHYHDLFRDIEQRLHSEINEKSTNRGTYFRSFVMLLDQSISEGIKKGDITKAREFYDSKLSDLGISIDYSVMLILARFSSLLFEYSQKFGSTAVYNNYVLQYTDLAGKLHLLGLIDFRAGSHQIFNIDEYYVARKFQHLDVDINQKKPQLSQAEHFLPS